MTEVRHTGDDGGAHHRSCYCGDCTVCRAFEQWRAQITARRLLEDKRARLYATEVRNGSQAEDLLEEIKDIWYVEILHAEEGS